MSEEMMNTTEVMKARLKRLHAQALEAKFDLHDLSEELPTNWERILAVAQRCYDAHAALMEARKAAAASA
ncbi:CCE_0567 family metalloprotein [Trinickia symbiotica]|nr:CCE_0567 family metalloprotein [Trinickia symbiotica]